MENNQPIYILERNEKHTLLLKPNDSFYAIPEIEEWTPEGDRIYSKQEVIDYLVTRYEENPDGRLTHIFPEQILADEPASMLYVMGQYLHDQYGEDYDDEQGRYWMKVIMRTVYNTVYNPTWLEVEKEFYHYPKSEPEPACHHWER